MLTVKQGKRYRLAMSNNSGDSHPVHLHRHSFEVMSVGDKRMPGLMKDTLNIDSSPIIPATRYFTAIIRITRTRASWG